MNLLEKIFASLFCAFACQGIAQDTLVKLNKEKVIVKVLEISSQDITYRRYDMPSGPVFKVLKLSIAYIVYSNGEKEIFNKTQVITKNNSEDYVTPSGISEPKDLKKNRLSFSVNIVQLLINERSLYMDYLINKRHSIGISLGQVYANKAFQFSHERYIDRSHTPCAVYAGFVSHIDYKFYYSKKRKQYFGLDLTYKNIGYTNASFINIGGENNDEDEFTRNEKANVYIANIVYGSHLVPIDKKFNLEIFVGLGCKYKVRDYTTTESRWISYYVSPSSYSSNLGNPNYTGPSWPPPPETIGSFHVTQSSLSFIFGIKLGFATFLK